MGNINSYDVIFVYIQDLDLRRLFHLGYWFSHLAYISRESTMCQPLGYELEIQCPSTQ